MRIAVCIGQDFDVTLTPHLDNFDDDDKMLAWYEKEKPVLKSLLRKLLDENGFRKTQAVNNDQRRSEQARC